MKFTPLQKPKNIVQYTTPQNMGWLDSKPIKPKIQNIGTIHPTFNCSQDEKWANNPFTNFHFDQFPAWRIFVWPIFLLANSLFTNLPHQFSFDQFSFDKFSFYQGGGWLKYFRKMQKNRLMTFWLGPLILWTKRLPRITPPPLFLTTSKK